MELDEFTQRFGFGAVPVPPDDGGRPSRADLNTTLTVRQTLPFMAKISHAP